MRQQIRMAMIVALISAGTATAGFAQGSVTQDPGRLTPGNLTTGRPRPQWLTRRRYERQLVWNGLRQRNDGVSRNTRQPGRHRSYDGYGTRL